MSLAIITVIGQCIGAGDEAQCRFMAKKLMKITYAVTALTCITTICAHAAHPQGIQRVA